MANGAARTVGEDFTHEPAKMDNVPFLVMLMMYPLVIVLSFVGRTGSFMFPLNPRLFPYGAPGPVERPAISLLITCSAFAALGLFHCYIVLHMTVEAAMGGPRVRGEYPWSAPFVLWCCTTVYYIHYVTAPSMIGAHWAEWIVAAASSFVLLVITVFILSTVPQKVMKKLDGTRA